MIVEDVITKKRWFVCLKSIVLASLSTLGGGTVCSLVIAAALMEFENQLLRNAILYVILMVMYAVFFYRFHMRSRFDTYAEHTDRFEVKK